MYNLDASLDLSTQKLHLLNQDLKKYSQMTNEAFRNISMRSAAVPNFTPTSNIEHGSPRNARLKNSLSITPQSNNQTDIFGDQKMLIDAQRNLAP